jgi:hypothetical protein
LEGSRIVNGTMQGQTGSRRVGAQRPLRTLGKYFLHGALFTILSTLLSLVGVFLLVGLVLIGSLLGLVIGIGILLIFYGYANSLITEYLWFPVQTGWKTYLGHGFILLVAIVFVEVVPITLFSDQILSMSPIDQAVTIVLVNIIFAFIDGVIGKRVARIWRKSPSPGRVLSFAPLSPPGSSDWGKSR